MTPSSTPEYAMCDTRHADGVYVQWQRIIEDDCDGNPRDYLFQDGDYYCEQDQARLDAWYRDEWHFIGIRARANVTIVKNSVGFSFSLDSPGLWGIESDAGEDYLAEVFEEEKASLSGWIDGVDLSKATVV